jgi:hypothetical protein
MSGRPSRESIMTALFNVLVASVQTSFTATTAAGNVGLTNVSSATGLFIGLPVVGGSIPRGSVITQLSPLELSLAPTANAIAVPMTTGFLTTGRRLKRWSDVEPQPALFLRSGDEDLEYADSINQTQTIDAEIWIYSNAGQNPDSVPETALNNLLDSVQAAFAPDDPSTNRFTLGGLVFWCRLEGRIEKDPGDTSGQAIAVADVLITVP